MRNSLRKILNILICLCIALVMTGCGAAFKNEGTVSIDVGSIYAAAVKSSREAGDIVSEQEQEIPGEQEQPDYEEEDSDDNDEKYSLIEESLIVQAEITVTLSGQGYAGKTKTDTLKIPLSRFDYLDDDDELESEDDVAKILGIKKSFLTFKDIPIGSVITAHVDLDTSIVVNNEAKLKEELKEVFMDEYVEEIKTDEELEEEIEDFIDWYLNDMIYDSFSFGNIKGEGDSLPKIIEEGKNVITVELSLEEKEKPEPGPEPKSSIKLNFKFNDGDGKYVAKTDYPSIETDTENFMTEYVKALTGITLAGYQLNEDECEFNFGNEMSLTEIMKLLNGTTEITFYFDKETSEIPETFTIKYFFKDNDGKYIQKEDFPDKQIKLSDSDYEEQFEEYMEKTDIAGVGSYTFNKELSTPILPTIADYLARDITELKIYCDPISSQQEQEIPIEVNLTDLPAQSDESVVCHVDLYLMEETTFAALKKADVADYPGYFADESKYTSVTNIAYDKRVDSNGNDLYTLTPDETNKLILNVKENYYPQIYEGGFNKQEDDDAGIVAIVYYGNPEKNKSSPQSWTKAYVGFAGPFTLSTDPYTADLEMQALTGIPARVYVKLDGNYAYDYDNPQNAYMRNYIGFDYAIPAYDYDILNQSYTSEFCTEMLNQTVLQKYLSAGYTLKNITLGNIDFGIPAINLNFIKSTVLPTYFTFKYLFKDSNGSYVQREDFPNSVFKTSMLLEEDEKLTNEIGSSIKKMKMAGYEVNSDKSTFFNNYDNFEDYISDGYSELIFYCDPIEKEQMISINGHSTDETDKGNYNLKIYTDYTYEILYTSSANASELLFSTGNWYMEDDDIIDFKIDNETIFYEKQYYDSATGKMKDASYSAQYKNTASKFSLTSGNGTTIEFQYEQEQEQGNPTFTINISVANPKETLSIQQAVAEDDSSLTFKAVDSANTKYDSYTWGVDDQTSSEDSDTLTLNTSSWKTGEVRIIYLIAKDTNGVSHAITIQIETN